jgi:hypothetical protein
VLTDCRQLVVSLQKPSLWFLLSLFVLSLFSVTRLRFLHERGSLGMHSKVCRLSGCCHHLCVQCGASSLSTSIYSRFIMVAQLLRSLYTVLLAAQNFARFRRRWHCSLRRHEEQPPPSKRMCSYRSRRFELRCIPCYVFANATNSVARESSLSLGNDSISPKATSGYAAYKVAVRCIGNALLLHS